MSKIKQKSAQNLGDSRAQKFWFSGVAFGLGIVTVILFRSSPADDRGYVRRPHGTITFNKDIAPIIFARCSPCHHEGQSAPFNLLTYRDVEKRKKQITDVTQSGYMPPWLPEGDYGEFANDRRLTSDEKGLIEQWVQEGAREGLSEELPQPPHWQGNWLLGSPDLVVTMPKPYLLREQGGDVYRNFVLPVPIHTNRYVRAIELAPGNSKIVHHAFIKVDSTGASRALEAHESEPGFPGMDAPAQMPDGQFLTWQPGKVPLSSPEGLAWRLQKGSDLVLQLHMNRTGKAETIQSSVGLYFTDRAPTNRCFKLALTSIAIDIPAGEQNHVIEDSYVLPIDLDVIAVLPHAHYLAREMQGYAVLPGGAKKPLLLIRKWDFNWQGEYRYAQPMSLPKGTKLCLQFTYDNSTNNARNPNTPPKRVVYGPRSADEMCELWFQVLPRRKDELAMMEADYQGKMRGVFVAGARKRIRSNPADADAHCKLGLLLRAEGKKQEAWDHFQSASLAKPEFDEPHVYLGEMLRLDNKLAEAQKEFETVLRLNPQNSRGYGNLGFVFASQGRVLDSERCFRKALELNPTDQAVKDALDELTEIRQQRAKGGSDE